MVNIPKYYIKITPEKLALAKILRMDNNDNNGFTGQKKSLEMKSKLLVHKIL